MHTTEMITESKSYHMIIGVFYSSMEIIEVTQLPESHMLHIDVDVEMFMGSQGDGHLLLRLQEMALEWKPKEKP